LRRYHHNLFDKIVDLDKFDESAPTKELKNDYNLPDKKHQFDINLLFYQRSINNK